MDSNSIDLSSPKEFNMVKLSMTFDKEIHSDFIVDSLDKAIYLTKKASRNLAKRQLTWFRRDPRVIWLKAEGESADSLARKMLKVIKEIESCSPQA